MTSKKLKRIGAALTIMAGLASCSKIALSSLEKACRAKARIDVVDATAWKTFYDQVRAVDADQQRSDIAKGVLRAPGGSYVKPFPYVPGYEFRYDILARAEPIGLRPVPANISIEKGGHLIAVARNFVVSFQSLEIKSSYSCTSSFPELYGIPRIAVLK